MIFIMLAVRRENLTSVQIFQRPFAKRAPEAGTDATAHKPGSDSN